VLATTLNLPLYGDTLDSPRWAVLFWKASLWKDACFRLYV